MFQYFLKVVSTRFQFLDGRELNTHQYSVTQYERDCAFPSFPPSPRTPLSASGDKCNVPRMALTCLPSLHFSNFTNAQ